VLDFGQEIETEEEISVGSAVTVRNSTKTEGEFILPSNTVLVVNKGKVDEIKTPETTENKIKELTNKVTDLQNQIQAKEKLNLELTNKNTELTNKVAELEGTVKNKMTELENQIKMFNTEIAKEQNETPPPNTPQDSVKKDTELFSYAKRTATTE
jgi:peptidoglycan hydrolase CwlO-like protein